MTPAEGRSHGIAGRRVTGPPSDAPSLLQAVAEVARLAGESALAHFRSGLTVDTKSDGSPVTEADREAERIARAWIEERFPSDGILGEEFGETKPRAARRWIVDPIDGTKSFIHGVPLWGTLVGLMEGDRVLAGAAHFAALGESIAAAEGAGCWWNGERARVSSVDSMARATVVTTDERFTAAPARRADWERLTATAGLVRSWGDCFGYLLVATGRAEVMTDGVLSAWDAAAVMPIITEAGGVFTDWNGTPTALGGSAIATNWALATEARTLLGAGTPR